MDCLGDASHRSLFPLLLHKEAALDPALAECWVCRGWHTVHLGHPVRSKSYLIPVAGDFQGCPDHATGFHQGKTSHIANILASGSAADLRQYAGAVAISPALIVSRITPKWGVILGLVFVAIHAISGFVLLFLWDIQLLWGLPYIPSMQLAGTLVYLALKTHQHRGWGELLLAAFAVVTSVLSGLFLLVGLAFPQTILGDVALFQVAVGLFDGLGEFIRHLVAIKHLATARNGSGWVSWHGQQAIHCANRCSSTTSILPV